MLAALTAVAIALSAQPAIAAPGDLDLQFGTGGVLSTDFGGTYDWAYAAAVQPDGGIVAAGVTNGAGTYDFALTRYHPDGSTDPSFGDGGKVTTDFGTSFDWAYAAVIQPDGKIVAGGVTDASGSRDFALARYNPDGSLDPGFGTAGLVIANLRPLSADTIFGLALQPDGKILAGGTTFPDTVALRPNGDFMLARYTADGSPDATFGVGGVVTTDFGKESWDEARALALQPDGSILLGGSTNNGSGPGVLFGADNLALARYTRQGILDASFGNGGKVVVDGGSMVEAIRALALGPDGTIVAAGFVNGEHRGDLLLARFDRFGAIDPAFGTGGMTVTDFGSKSDRLEAVALQPDGWIVAAGQVATEPNADFAAVRYDPQGHLDPSFGKGGLATFDFQGREDRAHALVLQPDGAIIAVGQSETNFAAARFTGGTTGR
ncbi:MAG: hypothetical protein QOE80_4055 [Actinomycetota bacterium]|jgi:uncharacterized delta-60 repeat protein|nr:hypothetical protein [Actinomycetota bacterium]